MEGQEETIELCLTNNSNFECCICINTCSYNFINMKCCKQMIHDKCLIEWLLSSNNKYLKCAICRSDIIDLNDTITLGNFIDSINSIKSTSSVTFNKRGLVEIINRLYGHCDFVVIMNYEYNDENESENNDVRERYVYRFNMMLYKIFVTFLFIFIVSLVAIIRNDNSGKVRSFL